MGISFALELILRFQPESSYQAPLFLHKLPLLPFERIEFLQTLIPALLNAVLIIEPHVVSSAFTADAADSQHPEITTSWTVHPRSLSELERRQLVMSVGELSFNTASEILKRWEYRLNELKSDYYFSELMILNIAQDVLHHPLGHPMMLIGC